MGSLDESKTQWIISEKRKGNLTNRQIVESMKIPIIWVKKVWPDTGTYSDARKDLQWILDP